mmetsp:Transcript_8879/g.20248  ORF Transcript_8879/g.20248 Transcript_8879/m.20248 type:complete len:262 (+) Transcript_8879:2442-3227(+)
MAFRSIGRHPGKLLTPLIPLCDFSLKVYAEDGSVRVLKQLCQLTRHRRTVTPALHSLCVDPNEGGARFDPRANVIHEVSNRQSRLLVHLGPWPALQLVDLIEGSEGSPRPHERDLILLRGSSCVRDCVAKLWTEPDDKSMVGDGDTQDSRDNVGEPLDVGQNNADVLNCDSPQGVSQWQHRSQNSPDHLRAWHLPHSVHPIVEHNSSALGMGDQGAHIDPGFHQAPDFVDRAVLVHLLAKAPMQIGCDLELCSLIQLEDRS